MKYDNTNFKNFNLKRCKSKTDCNKFYFNIENVLIFFYKCMLDSPEITSYHL